MSAPTSPAETGLEDFVYGRHPVLELLKAEGECRVNKLWLLKGGTGGPFEEIVRAAEARRVVFQWVDRDRLDGMVRDGTHQGVVARVSEVGYGSLDDLLAEGTPSPLVLLDGIEDPHNVGAIIRSAAFFGAKGVVVPRWRSAGLSGTVMKVSAGALSKLPLIQVTNIAQTLIELKEKGYWIYGADGSGEAASAAVLNAPLALVIGAEGEGLHRLVRERCDALLSVPGSGGMESLNASCAAAVLLHDIFRRTTP
jgi:23S rRNA (guanosine2251-2'-O)-methyltransferase